MLELREKHKKKKMINNNEVILLYDYSIMKKDNKKPIL
jgi:hypothetical protein